MIVIKVQFLHKNHFYHTFLETSIKFACYLLITTNLFDYVKQ